MPKIIDDYHCALFENDHYGVCEGWKIHPEVKIEKKMELIAGMCGNPDAKQACRNILKIAKSWGNNSTSSTTLFDKDKK